MTEPVVLSVYAFTFLAASLATITNIFFGLILAWVLVRYDFNATIHLPFALSISVGDLTLMTYFVIKKTLSVLASKKRIWFFKSSNSYNFCIFPFNSTNYTAYFTKYGRRY